jgi:uncharacterized protein YcbX
VEIAGLWRYPVKSMQGETLSSAEIGASGIAGDRRWGVQVADSGHILSAKREGRLLTAQASTAATVVISLPSGECLTGVGPGMDTALTNWLGRTVRLVEAEDHTTPTFDSQADETDDASPTRSWQGRPGAFVDSSAVHLVTTATLRAMERQRPDLDWRVARFRPNLLVDAPGPERIEDSWVGRRCLLGEVEVEIVKPCKRCVMVTRSQPGGLDRQLGVLSYLTSSSAGTLGVLGRVVRPGSLSLHDEVKVQ